jgi:hypothetical protein
VASLDDILTTAKNIVTAINGISNKLDRFSASGASYTYANITATTLVRSGSGSIAVVSVVTPGTTSGTIYDANSTGVTTSPVFKIPMTVGLTIVNMPVSNGIVVAPGTGQAVSISYS